MINLVSVWTGDKYGPQYPAVLHDMLARNLSHLAQKHWCITDRPDELPDYVLPIEPMPDLPGWWQKVALFSPDMPWKLKDRILYSDLDVAITGRLEDLAERPGIIQDEMWPCYNSSLMVWDHGDHPEIWSTFASGVPTSPGPIVPKECLPKGQVNGGDQEWITQSGTWDPFPANWTAPYKTRARDWPPAECKVVIFNGSPKPHEVGGWVKDIWKIGGFTSLPKMTGVNVDRSHIWSNITDNLKRDIPWFKGAQPHGGTLALICGGPSLRTSIPSIKDQKRRGSRIVSVNNTLRYLMANAIIPDAHVMLDARRDNIDFIREAPEIQYFLAAQVHPSLFDHLSERDVTLWHNQLGDDEELSVLATEERPVIPIPGGGTVGLRAMWLAFASGYRKLHVYGMDGSYQEGQHHAYPQSLNDGEEMLDLVMGGKHYACSRWMARQADEFRWTHDHLTRLGMRIWVHGSGLIPDMARAMVRQAA